MQETFSFSFNFMYFVLSLDGFFCTQDYDDILIFLPFPVCNPCPQIVLIGPNHLYVKRSLID